jgi:biopolymer transport protein TolR
MDVGSTTKGVRSDINVTPLVDVVLVLLIIFMVLTPSMLKHLSATVPKKPEERAPAMSAQSTIVVQYTANRELTVNGKPIASQALAGELADRLRRTRKKVVFFRAEDAAPYGEVVRLMDMARGSGAESLAIITEKM